MNRDMSIAVVGGSLVGPLAKLLLSRAGFDNVDIYEAAAVPQNRSGGVMGVRFPTIDVLESIGIDRRDIAALRDANVYGYDIARGGVPVARGASEFPGIVTSWDALHERLGVMVPDIQYSHRVIGLHEEDEHAVLTIEGPQKTVKRKPYDLILFADGRKSTGRELLDPERRLEYQGYVTWRGTGTPPRPVPSGFNRYYNIDGGKLFSVTEPIIQSGLSYWELSMNLSRMDWTGIAGGCPEQRAYLLPQHGGPLVRNTVTAAMRHFPVAFQAIVDGSTIAGIPVNDTRMPNRAAFRFGKSWAVLLGDALIPVRLQVGAGLNQGLLETQRLARSLRARFDFDRLMRDWE